MTLTDGLIAVAIVLLFYAGLVTYYAVIYKRQLLAAQRRIEQYQVAAAFAQADASEHAEEYLNGKRSTSANVPAGKDTNQ
jgi:hypothetical protein